MILVKSVIIQSVINSILGRISVYFNSHVHHASEQNGLKMITTDMNTQYDRFCNKTIMSSKFHFISLGMHHDVTYKRPECLAGFIMSGGTQGISQCGAEGFQNTMR